MKTTKPATAIQQATLEFLISYQKEFGIFPSTRDVSENFGIRQSAVEFRYKGMEKKGMIERIPGKARAVRPVNPDKLRNSSPLFVNEVPSSSTKVDLLRWKGYGQGVGLAAVSGWIINGSEAFGVHAAGHEVSLCLLSGLVKENGERVCTLDHTGLLTFMGIVLARLA